MKGNSEHPANLADTLAPGPVQTSRRSSRSRRIVIVALALAALAPNVSEARSKVDLVKTPRGWRYTFFEPYAGVEALRFERRHQRISVVAIAPDAAVQIGHVLAHEQLGAGRRTGRPTSICARLDCIAAMNGAFFDRSSGLPFSGIISGGELIRSVTSARPHVEIGQGLLFGRTTPPIELVTHHQQFMDPVTPATTTRTSIKGVNRPRGKHGLAVYTRRWGSMTPGPYGRELLLRALSDVTMKVGTQGVFEAVELRKAGGYLRSDEIVVSGTGKGAEQLRTMWQEMMSGERNTVVALDIAPGPSTLIGTRPLLLRDGRVLPRNGSSFASARHPRSILASRPDGTILLVVIDGRTQRRRGMSLMDAARFVKSLGASRAANLDGGGSSALVVNGRLHSRPPGSERKVSTALVVLPAPGSSQRR